MEIFIQILINSIVSGLLLMLVAYGFSLIFRTNKVFHIAHGGVYVASVYFLIFIHSYCQNLFILHEILLWGISIILTILFVSLLALLIELLVYRPLYKKQASEIISLITSLGLYIVIVNMIALLFGNETQMINNEVKESYFISDIIITHGQQVQFLFAIICLLVLAVPVNISRIGKKLQAVADNQEIASVIGINVKKMRLIAIIIGSLLAASGALLKAYDVGIDPHMGMSITLSAVVVVILAGKNSFWTLLITAILISTIQNFTEWFLSAQWKEGITYLILIIILLFRTEGIMSYKLRIENR
ncbi:MAG: branched-chain amino acid ABC transporter permease [Bacteroidales bacterium]|nr:branched-chain amino acid ABC transporter permease [Bacteroidales bacterium]